MPGRLDRKESDITEQLTVFYVNPVRKIGSTLGFSKMEVNIVNQLIDIRWLEEQKRDCWVCPEKNNCRKQLLSLGLGKQRRGGNFRTLNLDEGLSEAGVWSFGESSWKLALRRSVWQVPRTLHRGHSSTGAQKSVSQCVSEHRPAHTPVFKGDMSLVPTSTDSGTRNWRLQPAVCCYWDDAATHWKTRKEALPFPSASLGPPTGRA